MEIGKANRKKQIEEFIKTFCFKDEDYEHLENLAKQTDESAYERLHGFVDWFDLGGLFENLISEYGIDTDQLLCDELSERDEDYKDYLDAQNERQNAWRY